MWGALPPAPSTIRGVFQPIEGLRLADISDGTSNTLVATDVKVYQPLCAFSAGLSNITNPANVPSPLADPYSVAPEYTMASCNTSTRTFSHVLGRRQPA